MVGSKAFGNGRGAVLALEGKYRLNREASINELQDAIFQLNGTPGARYDPTPTVQQLRRMYAELDTLRDTATSSRQKHPLIEVLLDPEYKFLKTVLVCDSMRETPIAFKELAARVSSFNHL